uniref:Uncharacterized protein n=1 Tax=Cannabis sativa TaxID=3483 RepID=A0A803PSM8_CANSA
MVLTYNKYGLHFIDPNAKVGDADYQNEVTSCHKDQVGKDTDLDTPDKLVEGNVGGKDNPDESDTVVSMAERKENHRHNNSSSQSNEVDEVLQVLDERKVEELMKVAEKISRKQNGTVLDSKEEDTEPCVKRIIDASLPERFRMPQMELYKGRTDLRDHLSKYNRMMEVANASDDAKCLCFPLTLSIFVEDWWKMLSSGSIHN